MTQPRDVKLSVFLLFMTLICEVCLSYLDFVRLDLLQKMISTSKYFITLLQLPQVQIDEMINLVYSSVGISLVITFFVMIWLLYLLLKANNWARTTILVSYIITIMLSFSTMTAGVGALSIVMRLCLICVEVYALKLLYTSSSERFFSTTFN